MYVRLEILATKTIICVSIDLWKLSHATSRANTYSQLKIQWNYVHITFMRVILVLCDNDKMSKWYYIRIRWTRHPHLFIIIYGAYINPCVLNTLWDLPSPYNSIIETTLSLLCNFVSSKHYAITVYANCH